MTLVGSKNAIVYDSGTLSFTHSIERCRQLSEAIIIPNNLNRHVMQYFSFKMRIFPFVTESI